MHSLKICKFVHACIHIHMSFTYVRTVQFTYKFTACNGLNESIFRFFKRHEASHACHARVKKYIHAVLFTCFESIACKRRNNACDVRSYNA